MGNDDPTTTIPGVTDGGPNLGLIITLLVIGTFAFFFGWHKVIGSIGRPVNAQKALVGGISTGISFAAFGVLALVAGQPFWGVLLIIGGVALLGYAAAPVRKAVADLVHHLTTKVPPEPPGPVARV